MKSQSDTNRKTLSALSRVVNQLYQSLFTNIRKTSIDDSDKLLIRDSVDGFDYKYILGSDLSSGGASYWGRTGTVLSPLNSGDDLQIDGEFLFSGVDGVISVDNGSSSDGYSITIQAGDADGATNDGGHIIFKGGDAILADSLSVAGSVYVSPGNVYSAGAPGTVYIGNDTYNGNAVRLKAEGAGSNISMYVEGKGTGSSLYLGSGNSRVYSMKEHYFLGNNMLVGGANAHYVTIFANQGQSSYPNIDLRLVGGKGWSTGNNDGGHIMMYGGEETGTGLQGDVYFGDGSSGGLKNDETETSIVAYDTTTGLLSYRSYYTITDTVSSKGFTYADDYSDAWTDHSLVTKKWVTDNFVAI